jgi:integrase/recombinase XerC
MDKNVIAFGDYLLKEKNYSKLTVNSYLQDLGFFSEYLSTTYDISVLSQVKYPQIRSWIVFLVDSGISNTSVNRKIASLKAFYKFLLKIKEVESSPLSKHQPLKTAKKVQIPFSSKEINRAIDVVNSQETIADSFETTRDKLIIELFYATGMRRAELMNLKLNSFDLSSRTVKVLGKRNKERIIPLLEPIVDLVKDYLKKRSELIFIKDTECFFLTKSGVKLYEMLVYRVIKSYFSVVSEKVKQSPHVLRHSFATHLLDNGADLNSVKELLGHSSLASTQIYVNSSLSELKKVHAKAHPRNKS